MRNIKLQRKKVFFNIRSSSRERMWDTLKNASEMCEVTLPNNVKQQSSIKIQYHGLSLMSEIKYIISRWLINRQKINNTSKNSDLIYLWGGFPHNVERPFIIELDNPYVPLYYHRQSLKKNKEKIKLLLDKAYKITCLSYTCKNHAIELYGKSIEKKSFINYPYMEENYKRNKRNDDGVINLVFVGINCRGKGGKELLKAFSRSKEKNIRLTFISNLSKLEEHKYKNDSRITFLPPQPREKLFNEIYPKMDIMVFPSLYESFGVVLLEALSFGMAIITINIYATPEIVKNNYNGKLLHHPFLQPSIINGTEVINCVDLRLKEFHKKYLNQDEFYFGLYEELKNAILEACSEYKIWQTNSLDLFQKKFGPKIWLNNFKKIIY